MIRQGLTPGEANEVAVDFDRAAAKFGYWTEGRSKATVSKRLSDAERKAPPSKQVPKYQTLAAVLGIPETDTGQQGPARSARNNNDALPPHLQEQAEQLRRDPAALAAYLRTLTKG